MKKSLFGLGFGVLLMLLMLAAMVSAPAEESPSPPPMPDPVCALQPLSAAEILPMTAGKAEPAGREETVLTASRAGVSGSPNQMKAEAPKYRLPYRLARFQAFHYPDKAG